MSEQNRAIGIVGGTMSGNHGAEAMLQVVIAEVRRVLPTAAVHVLTYYPEADAQSGCLHDRVFLHNATPAQVVSDWFLRSLLIPPGRTPSPVPERHGLTFGHLRGLDVLFDVAGVSYIDGREKFLPYNVLTTVPFQRHGVPVVKLSQAMGLFESGVNRRAARWGLPPLTAVYGRGALTMEALKRHVPACQPAYAPDLAFLLAPASGDAERHDVVVCPSSLVAAKDEQYAGRMAAFIRSQHEKGRSVALVAHSWRRNSPKPRNNDLYAIDQIKRELGGQADVPVFGEGLDAAHLKRVIGGAQVVVSSRFHGMIAALSSGVPTYVLGWSHKYREVLDVFELGDYCCSSSKMGTTDWQSHFESLWDVRSDAAARIQAKLPGVVEEAREPFQHLNQWMRQRA